MTAHGWFNRDNQNRPTILAEVHHHSMGEPRQFEFVIDTGAENTLIVPYWEKVLDIDKKYLVQSEYPIDTIGGPIYISGLPHCSIVFTDSQNRPYPIDNIMVYFFSPKQKKQKIALEGDAVYPNVIGRDVLGQVSLGYCQTSSCLFVTKQIQNYRIVLEGSFPPPQTDIWGSPRRAP